MWREILSRQLQHQTKHMWWALGMRRRPMEWNVYAMGEVGIGQPTSSSR